MQTYEPIMNALLAQLQAGLTPSPFRYMSRIFVAWEDLVQPGNPAIPSDFAQPALLLYDGVGFGGGKTRFEQRRRGLPPVRVLSRTIVVYAQVPGGVVGNPSRTMAGGTVFAPLSEAIEGVIGTPDGEGATNTLGGLVSHCWIEGDSWWLTGDVDPQGQGMMIVPVQIMIP